MIIAILMAASWFAMPDPRPGQTAGSAGVVVEEVGNSALRLWDDHVPPQPSGPLEKTGAAAKAGVRPGDVLLSWERSPSASNPEAARGVFRTPFDVRETELEQSSRGNVTLVVRRGREILRLQLPPGEWGLNTEPLFDQKSRPSYEEGKRLVRAHQIEAGVRYWDDLAAARGRAGDHVAAAYLFLRGGKALHDSWEWARSRKSYDRAVEEASRSGDRIAECQSLHEKGLALYHEIPGVREQYVQSAAVLGREVELRSGLDPDSLAGAEAMGFLSSVIWTIDDVSGGVSLARRAIAIQDRIAPNSLAAAVGRRTLARSVWNEDLREAEELARSAESAYERLDPDSRGHGETLNTLAVVELSRGYLVAAEAHLRRVLWICRRLGHPQNLEAKALTNLGSVAFARGDLATADHYYFKMLAICQLYGTTNACISMTREHLAKVSLARGDIDAAYDHATVALRVEEQLDQTQVKLAQSLAYMGDVARARGQWAEAEGYYRRAQTILATKSPNSMSAAQVAYDLALVAEHREDFDSARTHLDEALRIRDTLAPNSVLVVETHQAIGALAQASGDLAKAEREYRAALALAEEFAPGTMHSADAHHALALLELGRGNVKAAERELGRAVDALDFQSKTVGGSEESRTAFAERYRDCYRDYIQTLRRSTKNDAEAFHVLERSRASALLAMLAERDMDTGVARELDDERRRADREYERIQQELAGLRGKLDQPRIDEFQAQLRELRRSRSDIEARVRMESPTYARLRYPQPQDLRTTREQLDPGTLLLSYSLGKGFAFLFAVEPAGRSEPGLTVYDLHTTENELGLSADAYRNLVDATELPSPDPRRELIARSRSLYDVLLKPAESLIARYDRILILPDGPLYKLPFEALVRGINKAQPQYLVEWKPIHTAVSATVYAELKKSRRSGAAPPIDVAAFGDPKYPKLPEKKVAVTRGEGETEAPAPLADEFAEVEDPQLRSVFRGGFRFEPLSASRKEVEDIASLYAPRSVAYLGPDATEERATAIGKDVPIIHFATHAVINERFPLDSALVFTIPEHPKEGQDNGLLQAWEIFEKVRIDADLVTLSACESGLGREMGGEGLIGLTRAFQYAGARSVLASLWKVRDKPTAELMKRFYTYLKAGKTKDEALRLAQIDLIHSPNYSHPKDWAAFQLNGDWR